MAAFYTGADKRHDLVKHLPPRDQARALARWGYLQATRNLDSTEVEEAARYYADEMGQEWDDLTEAQRDTYRDTVTHIHDVITHIRATPWNR